MAKDIPAVVNEFDCFGSYIAQFAKSSCFDPALLQNSPPNLGGEFNLFTAPMTAPTVQNEYFTANCIILASAPEVI